MSNQTLSSKSISLENVGIKNAEIHYQLTAAQLQEITLSRGEGIETSTAALSINTGKFSGRSPKDRFIVKDSITENQVWWGDVNIPFESSKFDALYTKITSYLSDKELFVRDAYVCADPKYRLNVRVITETPWANLFCYNMFLRPEEKELAGFMAEWTLICAPNFLADPKID